MSSATNESRPLTAGEVRRLIALVVELNPTGPSVRNPSFTNAQSAEIHAGVIEHLADDAVIADRLVWMFDREYGHVRHLLPDLA